MLAPHDREDTEFGQVRRAPEDRAGMGEFVGAEPVLGSQFGGNVAAGHFMEGPRASRPRAGSRRSKASPDAVSASEDCARGRRTAVRMALESVIAAPWPAPRKRRTR